MSLSLTGDVLAGAPVDLAPGAVGPVGPGVLPFGGAQGNGINTILG